MLAKLFVRKVVHIGQEELNLLLEVGDLAPLEKRLHRANKTVKGIGIFTRK